MATVLLAMFEPSFDRLHLPSAGHPPPVLALPGHPAVVLCASIVAGPVDSVCAVVMARLVGGDAPGDDVAILALRRQDSGEIGPLDLVLPRCQGH